MIKVAFIGLGLIGKERLKAVEILQKRGHSVSPVCIFDPYAKDIDALARAANAAVCASLDDVLAMEPDIVVVAVPHDSAVETTEYFLDRGVRVLLEKPLGRSLDEAKRIAAHCQTPEQMHVGHNYRFFAGVRELIGDVRRGAFGAPIGMSMLLGHGGAPQDRDTWKLNLERAGGGCLIDPGIHLIDLATYMEGGTVAPSGGAMWKGFWKTGIDEDCRLVLTGKTFSAIDLHVSVVRWKSTFRVEVFGEDGYGIVEGRGRSYGPQTYRRGKRWGWQSGKSQSDSEELVVTTTGDEVFADELSALLFPQDAGPSVATTQESLVNMGVLEACRSAIGAPRGDI